MRKLAIVICALGLTAFGVSAKTMMYNQHDIVSMRDQGLLADERETNVLEAVGNVVYGATSGDRCHVFRFSPGSKELQILGTLPGPNTVMKGLVVAGDAIYVGTMLSKEQILYKIRQQQPDFDPYDVNLVPLESSWNTGHLYKISGIDGADPDVEDLGVPVEGQGIHTLAMDVKRGLIYGVTAPMGRFFIYDTNTGETVDTAFGTTYTTVSNHQVGAVTVNRELADLTPGEGEWNNRLIPKAMYVADDGTMYTSGWKGQILKYDPTIAAIQNRFSVVGWIPSVPGRHYWNRIDAIVESKGKLYMGTSDGYIIRLDPSTGEMENLGKPIRAVDVIGMAFSPLDGKLYGVSGGELEGMGRFWACDPDKGTFEVDYPALQVFNNRRRVGAVVATEDGTLVMSEAWRVADLHVLTPGEPQKWDKSGMLEEFNPGESRSRREPNGRFDGHKKLNLKVFPIPSALHGGSGYTAIQIDNDGKVYVGTAYYGKNAQLVQLDPETAAWRSIFRSDELTKQYGRGQVPGKIHTKLRLGADGRIYGAMKQGYEQYYTIRADIGEAPPGLRGSQLTCHFFSYDPATNTTVDLGPGWPQEGITSFAIDTERGYLYGCSVPGVRFLVYDLARGRVWDAGQIHHTHPTRYMPSDPGTGRVYHPGEVTPEGKAFMTVWEPEEFRLRDVEVAPEDGYNYRHTYASCCGPAGTNTYYGYADNQLFEMSTDASKDGKFRVRPICYVGVDGDEKHGGIQAIERGPDGRIYWASGGGRNVPTDFFAWDPTTKTKTFLGAAALEGEYITGGHCQGIAFDTEGNMAVHMLYAEIPDEQKANLSVTDDFVYEEIEERPYYLGRPAYIPDTYYSVYYVENATDMK